MKATLTHAVVSIAALDVRRRPDHAAELTSQLLLGEVVRLLGGTRGGQWWRVQNLADGYRGWVRGWGLVPTTRSRAESWRRRARARVARPVVDLTVGRGRGGVVSPLFLNSAVIAAPRQGRHRRVELPDGRRGWLAASAIGGDKPSLTLVQRIRSLMGVPYHWGGRTPVGFDCSAFTQQVLWEQGLALPRDCHHQFRASSPLAEGNPPGTGDLVFFAAAGAPPSHVGIGLGGGYFAHCRGRVMISSLDPGNPLCDKELVPQFVGWRRLPSRHARRGWRDPGEG